ncbi:DUF6746 family protein [Halomonas alkalisoli]|uniref:DUF6746 family protein n=1 Tax=Halomonas alkalisoli TaxID=2907158 RepID=UPI0034E2DD9D
MPGLGPRNEGGEWGQPHRARPWPTSPSKTAAGRPARPGRAELEDLGTIHELTYTLENALEKINEEVNTMAVTLEEVHLGSETGDFERVNSNGAAYLDAAQTLIP